MRTLLTVFAKEFLENLRDRRTLLSALLFGPLFGPLLFGLMVSRMLEQSVVESDVPLKITISGGQLRAGTDPLSEGPRRQAHARGTCRRTRRAAAVRSGSSQVVLLVPADYPKLFVGGETGAGIAVRGQRGFADAKNRGSGQGHAGALTAARSRNCGWKCAA